MDYSVDSVKRTKPIPGGDNQSQYRSAMRKIMEGLTKDDLDTLLFLCKDHIPPSRDIKNNIEFLKYLEDRDLISCHSAVFIAEALHIIRRMDLLKLIPCIRNKKHFEDEFLAFAYSSFSSYRVLTVQLQEELSQRDFESFRHECSQHLNIRSIDAARNVLSLLRNLEQEDVINGEDFGQLIGILENIDNVKPLRMFRRLLEGDESVVLPSGKQQQYRQNSEQDMFPDRRSAPHPTVDPPAYHSLDRVEAAPYFRRPGIHASISSGNGYVDPPSTKKNVHTIEPARYNFDDPNGVLKMDSRWFSPDEVTPKAPVTACPEPLRMESHQSLPPQYTYQNPHPRSHSMGDFSSMPATPQYRSSQSMQPVASYPQMQQWMQGQEMHMDNRPVDYQGYHTTQSRFDSYVAPLQPCCDPRVSPPQSYIPFDSRTPPTYEHHDPRITYDHPSTSQEIVDQQQHRPQILPGEGEHDSDSAQLPPLEEDIKTIKVSDSGKREDTAVEKLLRDSDNKAGVAQHTTDPQPEPEKKYSRMQLEEMRQRLREQKDCYYKMDSSPVGICILINNMNFVVNRKVEERERRLKFNEEAGKNGKLPLPNIELADREGSDKDADKLEKLFQRFDFKVQRYDNLDHRQMKRVLDEASDMDHTNYDCFMLIILSHGEQGFVYGVDGFKVSDPEIQAKFFAEKCTSLANKPKIIIIQACQGSKKMPVAYAPEADVIEHDGPVLEDVTDNGTPNKADFLLAYSTVPGYISYRSRLQGSYYVQEIIRIFKRYHEDEDLLSMMIMVTNAVGKYSKKQVPMPIPTLRKKVYFHLKAGCTLDDLDDCRVMEYPSIEPQERVMQETQNEH